MSHLKPGLVCSLIVLAVVAIGLAITRVHFDASKPPDPHAPFQFLRFAGLAGVALPAFIIVLRLVRKQHGVIERIPTAVAIAAIFARLALPPLLAAHFHRPVMWLPVLWLFFGAGFGEEIFFAATFNRASTRRSGVPFVCWGSSSGRGWWFLRYALA